MWSSRPTPHNNLLNRQKILHNSQERSVVGRAMAFVRGCGARGSSFRPRSQRRAGEELLLKPGGFARVKGGDN